MIAIIAPYALIVAAIYGAWIGWRAYKEEQEKRKG